MELNNVRILLTGPPGVGKTTVVKKVLKLLSESNIPLSGFYTEELRSEGSRAGFDVVNAVDQSRSPLARLATNNCEGSKCRLGKYVVHSDDFEQFQNKIFQQIFQHRIVVIDEIGKMEMFSNGFKNNIKKLFSDTHSRTTIIATVPITRGKPILLLEEIQRDKRSVTITVDINNRNTLPTTIFDMIVHK